MHCVKSIDFSLLQFEHDVRMAGIRLGRDTTAVQTRATQLIFFYDEHGESLLGSIGGSLISTRTATYYYKIEFILHLQESVCRLLSDA